MAGYIRFQGKDIPFVKASYTQKQDQIGGFDVEVPLSDIDRFSAQQSSIGLYWHDALVVSGIVMEQPQLNLTKGDKRLTVTLSCEDELTRLACARAKSDAHYQDLPGTPMLVTDVISDLLAYAAVSGVGTWVLSDISTMIDPNVTTTIDLRNKATLFSQIVEVIKSVPQLHLRYGGYGGGVYQLQIGAFGQTTHFAYQHYNLETLRLNRANARLIRIVEPISGRSADSPVTLAEMTDAVNPIYPISENPPGSGKWVVTNTSITAGCSVVEFYNVHKTRNDEVADSDAVQRAETANALYQRAVRLLQKSQPFQAFTAKAYFTSVPRIGDSVRIRSSVQEPIYDQTTEDDVLAETFSVDQAFLMTNVRAEFDSGSLWDEYLESEFQVDAFTLELTDSAYAEINDPALEIYERLQPVGGQDHYTSPTTTRGIFTDSLTFQTPPLGVPGDCNLDPLGGKLFAFPLPPIPAGATQVFAQVMIITPGHSYTIVQYPSVTPPLGFSLCVDDEVWDTFINVAVTVTVRFDFQ